MGRHQAPEATESGPSVRPGPDSPGAVDTGVTTAPSRLADPLRSRHPEPDTPDPSPAESRPTERPTESGAKQSRPTKSHPAQYGPTRSGPTSPTESLPARSGPTGPTESGPAQSGRTESRPTESRLTESRPTGLTEGRAAEIRATEGGAAGARPSATTTEAARTGIGPTGTGPPVTGSAQVRRTGDRPAAAIATPVGLAEALVPRARPVDPDATTVLDPVPDGVPGIGSSAAGTGTGPDNVPVGATRADLWTGADRAATEDGTGTFTQVLLTGLGGSVEPPTAPEPAPDRDATGWARVVATTRRLAARVAALRGDERTALLVVCAVVGVVLLLLAAFVVVVRLAAGGGDPAPAATPAAGAAPAATPTAGAAPTAAGSPVTSPSASPSPTGSPLPPSGGSFASKRSGLCLGAPQGRADAGAQLVQRACGTDFGTGFLLVATAQPGSYQLVNSAASRCADVLNASTDNGAPVVQWDCNGTPNQTFQLRPLLDPTGVDSGYVQIVAAHSGKCVDVTGFATNDGAPVQQWDCQDPVTALGPAAGNQSWKFTAD